MIPQISKALSKGYNSKQIIDYILKKFPEYSGKIKNAMAAGFTVDQVLNFISGGKKALANIEKESQEAPTAFQQMRNRDIGRRQEVNKRAMQGAGLAATAAITPIASQAVSSALSRALPQSVQQTLPEILPAIGSSMLDPNKQPELQQPINPQQSSNLSSAQQPPLDLGNANIPQPANIQQPEVISNPKEYLEKKGVLNAVNDSLKRGNEPLQVAAELGIKKTGHSKVDPELLKNIEEYAKIPQQQEKISPEIEKPIEPVSEELEKKLDRLAGNESTEPKQPEENLVATPHGLGEVKVSRNGKSIVEVDGKKHSVEDAKMLKPPKEAAIEAMELIKSFTPEEMRSTHHMLNSYDEQEKKGYFFFHDGNAYVVDDISPDEYEELSKEVADAKTTGETIIGEWAKGHGSRGAGYNKIVKGHRDRKVVPELVKKFRKLKVGYNLLAEWQRLLNEK